MKNAYIDNVSAIARVGHEAGVPWNVAIDIWEKDNPAAVRGTEDVGAARAEFYTYVEKRTYDANGDLIEARSGE